MTTSVSQYPLITRGFDTIVSDQTATLASSLAANKDLFEGLNLTPGSPMLALLEANAGVQLFMQLLVYKVLRSTRLATAEGDDLDSFGADFLFARYPATPSSGQAVFSRATAANVGYIPANTVITTNDGTQRFIVIPPSSDPGNTYDPTKGYVMLPGVYQLSVLVQAVTPGTIGNIPAGALGKIVSSTSIGASKAYNPAAFVNGSDAASDDQFRSAFALYIKSRDNGTVAAIENAIKTTNPTYTYSILENYIAANTPQPGSVLVYFDDGTGFPSQARQIELQNNVNAVRAAGVTPYVVAAAPVSMLIQLQANFGSSSLRTAYLPAIQVAVENYVNSLPVGSNLMVTRLSQVIYNAVPLDQSQFEIYNIVLTAVDASGRTLPTNAVGDVVVNKGQVLRFIPNPPSVNGVNILQPSLIVID